MTLFELIFILLFLGSAVSVMFALLVSQRCFSSAAFAR